MHAWESWKIFKTLQKKLEATGKCKVFFFYINFRISRTSKKSNETVLRGANTTRPLIIRISEHKPPFSDM